MRELEKKKTLDLILPAPADAAEPWQLGFQDGATPIMQGIIDLHHDIFFFLIMILVLVLWILVRALWLFSSKRNPIPQRIVHGTTIEILRTIFPSIILMFIAIPSFALLYSFYIENEKRIRFFFFILFILYVVMSMACHTYILFFQGGWENYPTINLAMHVGPGGSSGGSGSVDWETLSPIGEGGSADTTPVAEPAEVLGAAENPGPAPLPLPGDQNFPRAMQEELESFLWQFGPNTHKVRRDLLSKVWAELQLERAPPYKIAALRRFFHARTSQGNLEEPRAEVAADLFSFWEGWEKEQARRLRPR